MEQNRDSRFFLSLLRRVSPMCRVRGMFVSFATFILTILSNRKGHSDEGPYLSRERKRYIVTAVSP